MDIPYKGYTIIPNSERQPDGRWLPVADLQADDRGVATPRPPLRAAAREVRATRAEADAVAVKMARAWIETSEREGALGAPARRDEPTLRRRGHRSKRNRENSYLLDRRVQKTETFTGIDGINAQDRAVQESMGPIVDRTREHLGPADRAVIQARRLLLQATRTVEAGGTPPGVEPAYYALHPAEALLPGGTDWRTLLAPGSSRTELQRA